MEGVAGGGCGASWEGQQQDRPLPVLHFIPSEHVSPDLLPPIHALTLTSVQMDLLACKGKRSDLVVPPARKVY